MNYESYVPTGILKKSWMHKHTVEVPSVLVVFFDLDWRDQEWDNKKLECAARVEVVRSGLQGRTTYLIVVLVQSTPPNLPGTVNSSEEHFVRDRASQLYKACSLVQGQLYLLPVLGRLETTAKYVSQLEEALLSTAQKYYDQRVKKIKGHEDLLLLPQHNLLMMRYHFKTAFFTEFRQEKQDLNKALEDYRKAYHLIVEVVPTMVDHILEFKVVSGYCSYKICNILFRVGDAEGALVQFRKHIEFFRNETGPKPLAYEHASWMSKQYSGFADLLSAMVNTVKVTQRNHPGVYYQKAAFYAIERQRLCHTLCTKAAQSFTKEIPSLPEADYVGQRPWRKGLIDDQPSSPKIEHDDVAVMQANESTVEHPWQVIPLLSLATEHFKKYHSERTVVSLKVKMAEQYYQLGEYDKCLMLLMNATQMYRSESWWTLLSSVLQLSLRCAYLLGKVDAYITVACELIAKPIPLVHEEKIRVQGNLTRVLKGGVPDQEAGFSPASLQLAENNWASDEESVDTTMLTVNASDIACYVECRGGFINCSQDNGEIIVKVFLRSTAPFDAVFSHVMVHFNLNEYDSFAVNRSTDKIELITDQLKEIEFKFLPLAHHVYERLEITSIDLVYHQGHEGSLKVFKWNGTGGDYGSLLDANKVVSSTKLAQSIFLMPRAAKLNCRTTHSDRILDGEIFPLILHIENLEDDRICDVEVSIALSGDKNLSRAGTYPNLLDHWRCFTFSGLPIVILSTIVRILPDFSSRHLVVLMHPSVCTYYTRVPSRVYILGESAPAE
jgi:tetratricopeptide (TPR) repeat protein